MTALAFIAALLASASATTQSSWAKAGELLGAVHATGVDDEGEPREPGAAELHYFATGASTSAVVLEPVPGWVTAPAGSAWIGAAEGDVAPGTYSYSILLQLGDVDPRRVVVEGAWASDNASTIYVNGVSTGRSNEASTFRSLVGFSLSEELVAGANVLQFRVENAGPDPSPAGLLVSGVRAHVPFPSARRGDLLVTDLTAGAVIHIDPDSGWQTVIVDELDRPETAVLIDHGRAWVAELGRDELIELDLRTGLVGERRPFAMMRDLERHPDGRLVAIEREWLGPSGHEGNEHAVRWDDALSAWVRIEQVGSWDPLYGSSGLDYLESTAGGRLLARRNSCGSSSRIPPITCRTRLVEVRFGESDVELYGPFVVDEFPPFPRIGGFGWLTGGPLVVARDFGVVDALTVPPTILTTGEHLTDPGTVGIGPDDEIYVVDRGVETPSIVRVDRAPAAEVLLSVGGALEQPTDLDVFPAPEPESARLCAIALLAMAALGRRGGLR